jgi:hypothetical protein
MAHQSSQVFLPDENLLENFQNLLSSSPKYAKAGNPALITQIKGFCGKSHKTLNICWNIINIINYKVCGYISNVS